VSSESAQGEQANGVSWTALPTGPRGWVYLKDLVLPPEMQRQVEESCRRRWFRKAAERAWIGEWAKLCHFFGAQDIAYMRAPDGPAVIVAGDLTSEAFDTALAPLTREERCRVHLYTQDPWDDPVSRI
jgi:hypothetical protein